MDFLGTLLQDRTFVALGFYGLIMALLIVANLVEYHDAAEDELPELEDAD